MLSNEWTKKCAKTRNIIFYKHNFDYHKAAQITEEMGEDTSVIVGPDLNESKGPLDKVSIGNILSAKDFFATNGFALLLCQTESL